MGEEKLKELEKELEGASGLEQEGNEKELDPLWKQRGFGSLEEMISDMEGTLESEKAARSAAEQALLTTKKDVVPPSFNRDEYDEDPDAYSAKFNKAVQSYMEASSGPKYPSKILDDTVTGVLDRAEKSGTNRHVLYGTMRSLVAEDPAKKSMLDSPDGIRALGELALAQFKDQGKKAGGEVPGEHVQPKGSPSGAPKKSPAKESEVERLNKAIAEAAGTGKIDAVVDLTLKRNAAKLKLAKKG